MPRIDFTGKLLKEMPNLPAEYRKMGRAYMMDIPSDPKMKFVLDNYFMAVTYLGGAPWSDELFGKIFAFSILAGFPECCVVGKISMPLIVGSYRFCIRGGCVPDFKLIRKVILPYVQDLFKNRKRTAWLPALMERYEITGWEKLDYREWVREDVSTEKFFGIYRKTLRFMIKKNRKK